MTRAPFRQDNAPAYGRDWNEADTTAPADNARRVASRLIVSRYNGPSCLMPASDYGDALLYQSPALRMVTECLLAGATGGIDAYALACEYAGLQPFLPLDADGTAEYDLSASHFMRWTRTAYGAQRWAGLLSAWAMRCLMHAQAVTARTEIRATLRDATDAAPRALYAMQGASWSSYLESCLLALLDGARGAYSDKPGDVSILLAYRDALDVQDAIARALAKAARVTFYESPEAYQDMRDDGSVFASLRAVMAFIRSEHARLRAASPGRAQAVTARQSVKQLAHANRMRQARHGRRR